MDALYTHAKINPNELSNLDLQLLRVSKREEVQVALAKNLEENLYQDSLRRSHNNESLRRRREQELVQNKDKHIEMQDQMIRQMEQTDVKQIANGGPNSLIKVTYGNNETK